VKLKSKQPTYCGSVNNIAKTESLCELAKFELYRIKLVIYELRRNITNAEVL
jgi:hypothetical protein